MKNWKTKLPLLTLALLLFTPLPSPAAAEHAEEVDKESLKMPSARLNVNVILLNLPLLELFETESTEELSLNLEQLVRVEAVSYAGFFGEPTPISRFDVDVSLIEAPDMMRAEFEDDFTNELSDMSLTELPPLVRQEVDEYFDYLESQEFPLEIFSDRAVRIDDVLWELIILTDTHMPEIKDEYLIYVICQGVETGQAGLPVYVTYGQSPDTGEVFGMVGPNMYGGIWSSRSVVVDICAIPNPNGNFFADPSASISDKLGPYLPVFAYESPTDRLNLLGLYVDEIIDTLFVKSLLYMPSYSFNALFDLVVIDTTADGIGYEDVLRLLNLELVESAFRRLTPYNFYSFRYNYYTLDEVPELRSALVDHGEYVNVDPQAALSRAQEIGIIGQPIDDFTYIPNIIFVGDKDVLIDGALGIAMPSEQDPARIGGVLIGVSRASMDLEGLTVVVIHEGAHALGLAHPHDDIDERAMEPRTRWIYSWTDTAMSYAKVIHVLEDRWIFSDLYPLKTYYSSFDSDALDRAVIYLLLNEYVRVRDEVLSKLDAAGIELSQVPEMGESLNEADRMAAEAIEEFRRHNYFDHFEFAGVGMQLTSSFDYAWLALQLGYILDDQVEGLVQGKGGSYITQLEQSIRELEDALPQLQADLERERRTISSLEEGLKTTEERVDTVEKELASAEEALSASEEKHSDTKEQLDETTSKLLEHEQSLLDVQQQLEDRKSELEQSRTARDEMQTLSVISLAVAAVFGTMWVRRRGKRSSGILQPALEPVAEQRTKFCTNCGSRLPSTASFCIKCGKSTD